MDNPGADSLQTSELFVTGDHSSIDTGSNQADLKDSADVGSTEHSMKESVASVKNSGSNESKHSLCDSELVTMPKKPKMDTYNKNDFSGSESKQNSDESKPGSLQTPKENSDAHGDGTGNMPEGIKPNLLVQPFPEGKSARTGPRRPITEVFNDLLKECEQMPLQWLKLFEESEKFEKLCPTRLESMLQDAKSLEESLKKQKETLRQRVKALSETLQKP